MSDIQERVRSKFHLRSAKGIKVGDEFLYVKKSVEYNATVVQITSYLIILQLWANQSTLNKSSYGNALPYNWSIRKTDIGKTERLYLYA